jgi:two-component system OmpR family sensor kinase
MKFTPVDGTITADIGRLDSARAELLLSDSGPGIAPEQAMRIFERFYRANSATENGLRLDANGAGLGLAIAKWAVEANGGTISVASAAHGAAFSIKLMAA